MTAESLERQAFEAWLGEIEVFSTRGERLLQLGWTEALFAAYQEGRRSAVPDGWQLVPKELPEEATVAGMEASLLGRPSVDNSAYIISIWSAMLSASLPPPPDIAKGKP